MTNRDILEIAMQQTAIDSNCRVEDLTSKQNVVVISKPNENARRYLNLPFFCDLVSYGSNIVASVDERIVDFISQYINHCTIEHCFETPNLHLLTKEFEKYGKIPCFMAEYFLPDVDILEALPCSYTIKILNPDDFSHLYLNQWSNTLCEKRKHLDMLVAAAFDNDKIIGMAGCSADCDSMWQIGVDVLPEYRRNGIASALTSQLAVEILKRGKVPFYCCAWSNIRSVRNAIKSGFRPAWVHLTSIDTEKAIEMTK
jgi:GNAT superfamily N-acetyltransferase